MDSKERGRMIDKIAKLEAGGNVPGPGAGCLKQVLFTDGMDYPDIKKAIKKAAKARARQKVAEARARKRDGKFKGDDPKTPNINEAYRTG